MARSRLHMRSGQFPRRRTGKEKVVLHGAAFVWSRTTSCRGTASASRLREVLLNFGLVGIERRGGNLNSEPGFCRMSGKSGGRGWRLTRANPAVVYRRQVWAWRSLSDVKITGSNLTWSDELFGVIDRLSAGRATNARSAWAELLSIRFLNEIGSDPSPVTSLPSRLPSRSYICAPTRTATLAPSRQTAPFRTTERSSPYPDRE